MRAQTTSASLLDPGGGSSLAAAAQWIERVLLGEVAVILAIVAVAVVGLLFLTGRLAWGQAGRVVLGCAIVFGAPSIATGLMDNGEQHRARDPYLPSGDAHPPRENLPPSNHDPYSGA